MSDKDHRYPVIEIFGPTIQGEGIMSGTVSHFLRFGGCGLRCNWCDSMYAVDPTQVKANRTMMTDGQIFQYIKTLPNAPWVTLTGGDPAIQPDLAPLINWLNLEGIRVAIETQGQYFPEWLDELDCVTFSPKPPSSGNVVDPNDMALWLSKRMSFNNHPKKARTCVKVVVFDEEDFQYAIGVLRRLSPAMYNAFYFTAGTNIEAPTLKKRTKLILKAQSWLADRVLSECANTQFAANVHIGCQQHVLLWPDKDKGV
jgi:7-carboxy-7-deazaguanine synthase